MPKFTHEFKLFVAFIILAVLLGGGAANLVHLDHRVTNTEEAVIQLDEAIHPSIEPTAIPTASPSATIAPTRIFLRSVSVSPTNKAE